MFSEDCMEAILRNSSLKTNFSRYSRLLLIKQRFLTVKERRNVTEVERQIDKRLIINKTLNKLDKLLN